MKKRFSDEQIISILREAEAEAGVPALSPQWPERKTQKTS